MNSTIKGEEGIKDGAIPLLDGKELGHNQRTTKNFTTVYKIREKTNKIVVIIFFRLC